MIILRSLASAFLMYSRIPVPAVEWKEENRRYALCFFPLVGVVIGGLLLVWRLLCGALGTGGIVRGAVSVVLPVLVTGGIHIDGFCDTVDALCSYADSQRRLEIMKDPHIGSFAVTGLCCLMITELALFCETGSITGTALISIGYVLSRALSGIAAVTLKCAKGTGTLQSFVKPAHKKITIWVLSATAAVCAAAAVIIKPIGGALICCGAALCFIYYRFLSYKSFGGITGDTEGWFLQITEAVILAAAYTAEVIQP